MVNSEQPNSTKSDTHRDAIADAADKLGVDPDQLHRLTQENGGEDEGTETVPEAKTWLLPEQIERMEAAALHDSIPGYMQERDATLVRILADTGVRVGEAASLDVSMLSDDRTTLFMPSKIQKGSPPPATVELADATTTQLRRYLRDRWKDTPALFPSRQSDRMSKRSIRRRIKKLVEIADVHPQTVSGERGDPSDVSPHSLRHSVAYRMIGVEQKSLDDVQLKLRHAQRLTTDQVYSHLVPR